MKCCEKWKQAVYAAPVSLNLCNTACQYKVIYCPECGESLGKVTNIDVEVKGDLHLDLTSLKPKSDERCKCYEPRSDWNLDYSARFCRDCKKLIWIQDDDKPKKLEKLELIYPSKYEDFLKPLFNKIDEIIEVLNGKETT